MSDPKQIAHSLEDASASPMRGVPAASAASPKAGPRALGEAMEVAAVAYAPAYALALPPGEFILTTTAFTFSSLSTLSKILVY